MPEALCYHLGGTGCYQERWSNLTKNFKCNMKEIARQTFKASLDRSNNKNNNNNHNNNNHNNIR